MRKTIVFCLWLFHIFSCIAVPEQVMFSFPRPLMTVEEVGVSLLLPFTPTHLLSVCLPRGGKGGKREHPIELTQALPEQPSRQTSSFLVLQPRFKEEESPIRAITEHVQVQC